MANAPVVRDLNSIVNEISAAYAPQKELLNQQIASTETSGQAQQAGLAAQQQQAFQGIEQGAQNKGMFFSGFSPDAQAKYTATTYLPKLAELQATINNTKSSLYGKQAEMDTQARTQAYNVREGDVAALRGWEADQAKMAYEAEQNRIKMAFEAQQNAANRAAQAAASRAAKAPQGTQYTWKKNAAGGYDVYEGNKKANVDLATAVASQGGNLSNLVGLLTQGSPSDRKFAQQYINGDKTALYSTGAFYTGGGF